MEAAALVRFSPASIWVPARVSFRPIADIRDDRHDGQTQSTRCGPQGASVKKRTGLYLAFAMIAFLASEAVDEEVAKSLVLATCLLLFSFALMVPTTLARRKLGRADLAMMLPSVAIFSISVLRYVGIVQLSSAWAWGAFMALAVLTLIWSARGAGEGMSRN